jgi:hypothetical protein
VDWKSYLRRDKTGTFGMKSHKQQNIVRCNSILHPNGKEHRKPERIGEKVELELL